MQLFTDINSFIEFVESRKRFSKKVSLENMEYFVSLFDHPENKFKSIHVTGTNGKGSTVSYLKNIYLITTKEAALRGLLVMCET